MLMLSMHSITLRPSINLIYLALLVIFPCRPRFLLFSSIFFYFLLFPFILLHSFFFFSYPIPSFLFRTQAMLSLPATSSAVPNLPRGIRGNKFSLSSALVMSVSIYPVMINRANAGFIGALIVRRRHTHRQ